MHFIHCYHANDNYYDVRKSFKIPIKRNCHAKRMYMREKYTRYDSWYNTLLIMNAIECCICQKIKYRKLLLECNNDLQKIESALCDWYVYKQNGCRLPVQFNFKPNYPVVATTPTTINELVSSVEHFKNTNEDIYDKLERSLTNDVK